MDKFFKLTKKGTNVRTEVIAGFTTFLTMVYIVFVNPTILQAAGVPFDQVFMATIISAVIGTFIMAFFANYPIAIAPGMGLNAYFATVVGAEGLSYEIIFGTVFLAGILFILLSLTKIRETLIKSIPSSLKFGITAGIGLFIAFLGLRMSGIVVPNEANIVALGDLTEPVTLLTIVGLFATLILIALDVKGALFFGMLLTGVIGYFTNQLSFTNGFMATPPSPVFFELDIAGVFSHGLYAVVFVFLLITLFDTTGTLIGVSEQAGLMKNGQLPKAKSALMADAVATTVGSAFGTSPSTAYIESASGVGAGGRTGLTSFVVGLLFIVTMFFSPIVGAVSSLPAITSPVLIIVGFYMMQGLAKVSWNNFAEAFPTFAIILTMPLTSSIATGIAVGFITYPLLKLVTGKGKEVHWILYLFGFLFLIQLVFFPVH
ncbi:NCS2 family permease [Salinibacillus xinjiangensis]|uniref:NCS2 family permease n=1 Tax=Salinibacillus xinjiangensis TaxID=1229268 RepID=A0A6G1X6J2_9BACI|nr:NCS2 family permease [Salinibacillus xinjiangensis]MRG86500.1 NCS2 family permease [Salinibacillus xinjiangensis]